MSWPSANIKKNYYINTLINNKLVLSPVSLQLLQNHNFEVKQTDTYLEIVHRKAINWVWPFFSIVLGLAVIPLITFGNFKLGLLMILLLIYPVYQLFQELKQPKKLSIDSYSKRLTVETRNHKLSIFSFDQLKSIQLNTLDEYLEPNPFREEVVIRHFYVDLQLTSGLHHTVMTFKEAEQDDVEGFISEIEALLVQPNPKPRKVKA